MNRRPMRRFSAYAVAAALVLMAVACSSNPEPAEEAGKIRFMTLDPGHFHAALVHKSMYPQVDSQIHIYAPEGFDLDEHLKRIESFNTRAENPTAWVVNVHTGEDFFERMIEEKPGNVVVIAGKNSKKIDYIERAIDENLHLLVDKPWIIRSADLPRLEGALEEAEEKGLVAYDIMTERHEVTNALQRELVNDPAIFGQVVAGTPEDPAVYMKSVHHIMKEVAGAPLRRPAWFFDIREQGEALADIGTHLVDLSLWTLSPDQPVDHENDVEVLSARRWPTVMTREQFSTVTGQPDFTPELQQWVRDGELDFYANTAVDYTVDGKHVKLDILWDLRSDEHGDTHHGVYRGNRARVEVRQGAEENWRPEVYVVPASPAQKAEVGSALRARVEALQGRWAGIAVEDLGQEFRVTVPDEHRLGHEAHFGEVTEQFLQYLEDPGSIPEWEQQNMVTKYYITTTGHDLSQTS